MFKVWTRRSNKMPSHCSFSRSVKTYVLPTGKSFSRTTTPDFGDQLVIALTHSSEDPTSIFSIWLDEFCQLLKRTYGDVVSYLNCRHIASKFQLTRKAHYC